MTDATGFALVLALLGASLVMRARHRRPRSRRAYMDDTHARSLRWAALAAVGLLLGWLALTVVLIQMANEAMP